MNVVKRVINYSALVVVILLQGCSGNGFHLRNNVDLPKQYQRVQIENISPASNFTQAFQQALEEAGGELLEDAPTIIKISNYQEGRRVVAYTSERKVREYLLFLKFSFSINAKDKSLPIRRISIDRTFLYDPNFALGKAEEETQIRNNLYEEAARLILLRLQYSKD